jgi:Xaa-Pro aminopeptidase
MNSLIARRLAALRGRMQQTGTDLVALAPGSHLEWLLGARLHAEERPCFLLIALERETLLMPDLNVGWFETLGVSYHKWSDSDGPGSALKAALSEVGAAKIETIGLDEKMRTDFALLLLETLPNAKPRVGFDTIGVLRMHKDDDELAALKASARVADYVMQKAWESLRPGITEIEVGTVIRESFLAAGTDPKFWIVGAGANSAFPHSISGPRCLAEGDVILIDIGARKSGYYSDITRMSVIGRPPDGYREVHDIVERAVQAAMEVARPGVLAKRVDEAARQVIEKAGYGQYYPHRLGHGLGLDEHEPPYLSAASTQVLAENMVFTIEPGIYIPGRFGIRLEELVVLRHNGPELMSSLPRTVHVISN